MNEDNLYYKRGIYIIDKLLRIFNNDSTFYKNRDEYLRVELNRLKTNDKIVCKDFNSFFITSLTALLGINKENIEQTNKHNDYNIHFFNEKNKNDLNLEILKEGFKEFTFDRKITTTYDDWLCVENCDYPTMNYLMNIRNGLMHSEYECLDTYGYMLSINNSNYTHFKSKVLLPGLINFSLFYFGNNSFTGLSEKFNIYSVENNKINNSQELIDQIKKITITEVKYESLKNANKTSIPEGKLYKLLAEEQVKKGKNFNLRELLNKTFNKNYIYETNEKKLDEFQKELVRKMIEKYYGPEFYKLNEQQQIIQLGGVTRYLMDSRSVISEWISDYMYFFKDILLIYNKTKKFPNFNIDDLNIGPSGEDGIRSVFACRTALLIIKLYHILYRIQNKKYEEIDYNKITFDLSLNDYNYERIENNLVVANDFAIDKAKLLLKDNSLSNKELENKVICEIIRNSLSHGNIEINFKLINDEIVEYIVFEDSYHSKIRKLEITLDKLEEFLKSEAFETKNCLLKEEKSKSL